ncbi:MAG: TIGR04076 family protein [Theionarchaea archaeon]|nr:TIGR04076 family protein [Theionarchaea archaeon]MBU7037368.1 TIGR04076 family protein [Theionarchaea archaeon]
MIEIEVVRILEGGACPFGFKPGDIFQIDENPPAELCHWAYLVILPFATALRFGGDIPWEEKGICSVCCPDPKNPVVFEIRRVK